MTNQNSDTALKPKQSAIFTTGSTMRHVITMTMAGAVGLISIFAVDLLNLFYISLLGQQELTAAVGYASTIMFLTVSLSIGFTIAGTAIVSKTLGAGDGEKARYDAGATLVYIFFINCLSAILLFPLLGPILTLLGAVGRTHAVALDFMQIVTFAIPLMGIGMGCSGLLRARGDGKRAMYVTLSAGFVAALIDPLLIVYLDLGVRGAAISTVFTRVALCVSGLYGVLVIHKMIAVPNLRQLSALLRPYLIIAIPAMLTQIATPFSNAYMTSVMSEFGDGAVTGWTIIGRLVPLAFVAIFTMSAAVGPILGQNLGAKLFDRINSTMWDCLRFAFVYTLIVWALLAIFAGNIISLFGASEDAADLVRFFSLIIGGTYVFQGGLFVANAAFNNLGYPILSTVFNWGRATLGTIPFALVGSRWGPNGAMAGYGIGGILFGVGAIIVCFVVIRKLEEKHRSGLDSANS